MATGNIVPNTAKKDADNAYVTISVGSPPNVVEFNCVTPLLKDDLTPKSAAELKADLTAEAKRQFDQQNKPVSTALSGVSGSVTI